MIQAVSFWELKKINFDDQSCSVVFFKTEFVCVNVCVCVYVRACVRASYRKHSDSMLEI